MYYYPYVGVISDAANIWNDYYLLGLKLNKLVVYIQSVSIDATGGPIFGGGFVVFTSLQGIQSAISGPCWQGSTFIWEVSHFRKLNFKMEANHSTMAVRLKCAYKLWTMNIIIKIYCELRPRFIVCVLFSKYGSLKSNFIESITWALCVCNILI